MIYYSPSSKKRQYSLITSPFSYAEIVASPVILIQFRGPIGTRQNEIVFVVTFDHSNNFVVVLFGPKLTVDVVYVEFSTRNRQKCFKNYEEIVQYRFPGNVCQKVFHSH